MMLGGLDSRPKMNKKRKQILGDEYGTFEAVEDGFCGIDGSSVDDYEPDDELCSFMLDDVLADMGEDSDGVIFLRGGISVGID